MNLDVRRVEGIIVFDLDGKIIGRDSVKLQETIDEYIASSLETPKLLFNLSGVSMMDSSGFGVLISAQSAVKRKEGRIGTS